jgi:ferredoxin-NADP reductase
MLARPYSFVNAPGDAPHEFLIVELPQGMLSPRLAQLREGDAVWIGNAHGFFVCDEVPAATALWMMATGTGIAPFLSMLRTDELWRKFERVVLVHGVRWVEELVYPKVIASVQRERGDRFFYAPFVSRGMMNCEKVGAISAQAHTLFTLSPRGRGCPEGAGEGGGPSFSPSPPAPLPQGERGAKRNALSQEDIHINPNRSSRENHQYFSGRITASLADGQLEKAVGCMIDKENAQVMLCGNPAMVEEVRGLLGERGMRRHRQRAPGQVTTEVYL